MIPSKLILTSISMSVKPKVVCRGVLFFVIGMQNDMKQCRQASSYFDSSWFFPEFFWPLVHHKMHDSQESITFELTFFGYEHRQRLPDAHAKVPQYNYSSYVDVFLLLRHNFFFMFSIQHIFLSQQSYPLLRLQSLYNCHNLNKILFVDG